MVLSKPAEGASTTSGKPQETACGRHSVRFCSTTAEPALLLVRMSAVPVKATLRAASTLMLPLLDYARSYRPLVDRLARQVPAGVCVYAPELSRSQLAALGDLGRVRRVVAQALLLWHSPHHHDTLHGQPGPIQQPL